MHDFQYGRELVLIQRIIFGFDALLKNVKEFIEKQIKIEMIQ